MPERQAPAQPLPAASPMARTDCAGSAAEAVAEILACADMAVGAIGRQAEAQVREMTERVEVRPAQEAERRRAHLVQLRGELAERAAGLALSYGSILEELGAIDRMLAGEADGIAEEGQDAGDADPRVAAIKMTLRERRRVHVPSDAEAPPAAPWAEPADAASGVRESTREVWPAQATQWQEAEAAPEAWPPAQAPVYSYSAQTQVIPPAPPQVVPMAQAAVAPPLPAAEPAYPAQPEAPAPRRTWRWWQRAA